MRIHVVDDNPDFRLVIAEYLAEGATQEIERTGTAGPDTVIEAKPWDPQRGVPDAQFDWARIQAIVINYEPGATSVGSNAFVWLAQTKKASGKALIYPNRLQWRYSRALSRVAVHRSEGAACLAWGFEFNTNVL